MGAVAALADFVPGAGSPGEAGGGPQCLSILPPRLLHKRCSPAYPTGYAMRSNRLARSTRDLLNSLDTIAKAGASFRPLGGAWADTATPHGRLMLTVLGGLAGFERELIRARTAEGREHAKARGVHMGRKPTLTTHQKPDALTALADGTAAQADVARRFNVSQSTISRLD